MAWLMTASTQDVKEQARFRKVGHILQYVAYLQVQVYYWGEPDTSGWHCAHMCMVAYLWPYTTNFK